VSSCLQQFAILQVLAGLSVFNGESSCMSVSALFQQIAKPERSRNSQILGEHEIIRNGGKTTAF